MARTKAYSKGTTDPGALQDFAEVLLSLDEQTFARMVMKSGLTHQESRKLGALFKKLKG